MCRFPQLTYARDNAASHILAFWWVFNTIKLEQCASVVLELQLGQATRKSNTVDVVVLYREYLISGNARSVIYPIEVVNS